MPLAALCSALLPSLLAAPAEELVVYVATGGDDAWSGTLPAPNAARTDGPLRTLTRARDLLRAGGARPKRVVLRGGTHHLTAPLTLGPEDSGTATAPVVWEAMAGEQPVISGGVPATGWQRRGDLAVAPLPAVADWPVRQLRAGDRLATLARHPNRVPDQPYTGGWLFAAAPPANPWTSRVERIHTAGDWMEWEVTVPAAGRYAVWLYYGAQNAPFGRTDMGGRTSFQVDGGEAVPLANLPDTGSFQTFRWSRCATLDLAAGRRIIRWTNRQGGGLNFNAFALCSDEAWQPQAAPPAAPTGGHLVVVQAEDHRAAEGKELVVLREGEPGRPDQFQAREGDLPDWDYQGAELLLFPAWGWVGGPVPVAGVDRASRVVKLTGQNVQQKVEAGNRYFVQNVREALDEPGEFFHDTRAGELLYRPATADLPREAVVAKLDRLVVLQGDAAAGRFVEHVRFRGLTLRDTSYSLGVASLYTPADAALHLAAARDCQVRDCTFRELGGYAVRLAEQSARCRVLGCTMTELGQGGVIAVGTGADQATDCEVAGCQMSFLGRVYKHVAGVYVTTGSGFRVAHNTITDVPRYGISFKSFGPGNASHRCTAEYNAILRSNLETNDTGAIETLGRDQQPTGNVIRYNLILDVVGVKHKPEGGLLTPFYTWGIYLDDYSSGTTVVGNIVARTVRGGYHNHLGFDNVCENNIFVDGVNQQAEWNGRSEMRRNTFRRNIVVWSSEAAAYLRSSGWDRAVLAACDQNLLWWTGGDLATAEKPTPEGSLAKWREAGFDRGSQVADPRFVDAAKDDYRLREDSPALALGFQPIPVERIGHQGWHPEDDR